MWTDFALRLIPIEKAFFSAPVWEILEISLAWIFRHGTFHTLILERWRMSVADLCTFDTPVRPNRVTSQAHEPTQHANPASVLDKIEYAQRFTLGPS